MTIAWLWRNRHDLLRWARFAARVPSEVQARGFNHLAAEARVRLALTADPRTRAAKDLDIASLEDGTLVVCTPAEKPTAQVAREVLTGAPGVREIQIVDPPQPTTRDVRSPGGDEPPAPGDPLATPEGDTFALGPAEARS